MPSVNDPLRGSCLCGGVRYEITEPFQNAGYCHCSRCRKLTGGLAGVNGRVSRTGFRLLVGDEMLGVYQVPGDDKAAIFCRICGSTLFRGAWPDGEFIGIRLGTLDGDPGVLPQYHIFVGSAAPWESIPEDGLPRYSQRRQ